MSKNIYNKIDEYTSLDLNAPTKFEKSGALRSSLIIKDKQKNPENIFSKSGALRSNWCVKVWCVKV